MNITVTTQIPHGNACRLAVTPGETPEIAFTPDPRGTPWPLWFCFRINAETPPAGKDQKIKLVMEHFQAIQQGESPAAWMPVYKPADQWWFRMHAGKLERKPDGQVVAAWLIPAPATSMEVALCFPYGAPDTKDLLDKSKGYWRQDVIGVSRASRDLVRLANDYESGNRYAAGLYLLARERAGDTPAAWFADGLLKHLSLAKYNPFLTWAVPLLDVDGLAEAATLSWPDLARGWADAWPRTEIRAVQRDVELWQTRCRAALALDIIAAPMAEKAGCYAVAPDPATPEELQRQATKWANVIGHKLGPDYAAQDFLRPRPAPASNDDFATWAACKAGVCALTLAVPFATAGATALTPKLYREAGRRVAEALLEKRK